MSPLSPHAPRCAGSSQPSVGLVVADLKGSEDGGVTGEAAARDVRRGEAPSGQPGPGHQIEPVAIRDTAVEKIRGVSSPFA